MTPTAGTHVAGVIGDPVGHSLSPVLHNAAFSALGVDWVYVAFPVAAGRGAEAVAAMRTLGIAGLSVTMPHKPDVAGAVDRLTPVASRLGAVNTVARVARVGGVGRGAGAAGAGGVELVGDNTDGDGFVDALRADEGWDPAGRRCVVLGAGGAARAVSLALAGAGAAEVGIVARRAEPAQAAAELAGPAGRVCSPRAVAGADLVVNATSVGMNVVALPRAGGGGGRAAGAAGSGAPAGSGAGAGELPFDLEAGDLGPGQLVVDLVYAPAVTPLLATARRRGARTANGVGMLLHQAGRQVRAWTGHEAPLDAMSAALLGALGSRPSG